ncbi:MAG: hypothetical protein CR994_03170 [Maribacter sp.]|nr:MAG: hypothetical protein CR994_03170 [Maribacter sp.]
MNRILFIIQVSPLFQNHWIRNNPLFIKIKKTGPNPRTKIKCLYLQKTKIPLWITRVINTKKIHT